VVSDQLRNPKLKIERAKQHVLDAEREIVAFIKSNPYKMFEEVEQKTGDKLVKVKLLRELPGTVETTTADAVHNLRVALDQLACCLAERNGYPGSTNTYFPFARSRDAFESKGVQEKIKELDPKAVGMICALKPYKGGNDQLWAIHALDLMDKHRSLVQCGTVSEGMNIDHLIVSGRAKILPPRWNPLGEDMTPFRLAANTKLEGNIQFLFEIAFRDEGLIGQPVVATLNKFVNLVEDILLTFETRFFV